MRVQFRGVQLMAMSSAFRARTAVAAVPHGIVIAACALWLTFLTRVAGADTVPLLDDENAVSESVLEAFLSPGEFSKRRITHTLLNDDALYALDLGLSAADPFAILQPDRVSWPAIGGLALAIEGDPISLNIVSKKSTDEQFDSGIAVRFVLKPLGQRFEPMPRFAARITEVEVLTESGGVRLLHWASNEKENRCQRTHRKGAPACAVEGIGLETLAMAISPDGGRLAMAFGGLRPRLEVYDIALEPKRLWQVLLSKNSGGAVETGFSSDGRWVVVLTAKGRMHRFDAATGGRHLRIPSAGRSARAIPPGRVMAVAGDAGEVKLWYLTDGTIAWRLPPRDKRGAVDRIAASGDGSRIALLEYAEDKTIVRLFEIQHRRIVRQFELDTLAVSDIALNEAGDILFLSHETRGLLFAPVKQGASPVAVPTATAERCTGRLAWNSQKHVLSCATPNGVQNLDENGDPKGFYQTTGEAAKWLVAVATEGPRIAAVGGGRLLVWWLPEYKDQHREH